jgi:exodeoxyribonuclease III
MKIISYNVNGIRAALNKGLDQWLSTQDFDVLCIQETKASQDQVDLSELEKMGLQSAWHSAEKKGYSGVATFFRKLPDSISQGMGMPKYDMEGRVLRSDWGDVTLLNCYFPSGTSGEIRQAFKMEFLDDFFDYIQHLKKERPNLIVAGDYNIAHTEMDIHDPVGNKKSSGFLPEERDWMTRWFNNGFVDTFRQLHPSMVEYSWWTYRAGARAKNKGWRIDYLTVSDPLKERIAAAGHFNDAVHSDHCPVFLEIK